MSDRHPWKFDQNLTLDHRAPRALEYIAQYLDRIDLSLERIAVALETGKASESIGRELRAIQGALNRKA